MKDLETIKESFYEHVKNLQDKITASLRSVDPALECCEDIWQREDHIGADGGGGRTRAFTGDVIENAGVNISKIYGAVNPEFAKKLGSDDPQVWAAGISLIIHPRNPKVPTVHANFRMIHTGEKVWFGGGADLTPFYPNEEDFIYFHKVWKSALAPYGLYDSMKKECDDYFVNSHRQNEMRGIGGFFYDHFNSGNIEKDSLMFMDISNKFISSYFPIVEKRKNDSFTDEDADFQLHRRGRYVEFNLLHDRGTMFGLKTNGRVDSILISLPGRCKFSYKYAPKLNSPHEKMMGYYKPKDWANMELTGMRDRRPLNSL